MFKNFVRRTVEGNLYKKTFLDEAKIFDFGPIFVGLRRYVKVQYLRTQIALLIGNLLNRW